jgi:hypothetical protein
MRFLSFAQISSRRQGHFQRGFLALASLWVIFCSVGNQAMSQQLRPLGFTLQASAGVPMGDFRTFASTGLGASFGGRYVLSESFTLTFDAAYTNFLVKEFPSSVAADVLFQTQTTLLSFLPGIRFTADMFYAGLQAGYVLRSMNIRRSDFGIEQPQAQETGAHWVVQPVVGVLVPLSENLSLDANCAYVPVQMQGSAFPSGAVVLNLGVQMRF